MSNERTTQPTFEMMEANRHLRVFECALYSARALQEGEEGYALIDALINTMETLQLKMKAGAGAPSKWVCDQK